jgi:hypothetical protein
MQHALKQELNFECFVSNRFLCIRQHGLLSQARTKATSFGTATTSCLKTRWFQQWDFKLLGIESRQTRAGVHFLRPCEQARHHKLALDACLQQTM